MSEKPAVLEAALAPFVSAGHRVSVVGSHLLLHDVPVVNEYRQIQLGTLVSTFLHTESVVVAPATHQVWFDGPYPCFSDGRPIEDIRCSEVVGGELAPNVPARYFFSNKEVGWTAYANHFDQLMELAPKELIPGVLYVSLKYKLALHLCCCGCGEKVVTPLSPAEWHLRLADGKARIQRLWRRGPSSLRTWRATCRTMRH